MELLQSFPLTSMFDKLSLKVFFCSSFSPEISSDSMWSAGDNNGEGLMSFTPETPAHCDLLSWSLMSRFTQAHLVPVTADHLLIMVNWEP